MKKNIQLLLIGILCLPDPANACGGCATEQIDYYILPHAWGWSLGVVIWLCALLVAVKAEDRAVLSSLPTRWFTTIVLILVSFLIGVAFVGPVPFAFLGLFAASATSRGFSPEVQAKISTRSKTGLKLVSIAVLICILAGAMISIHTKMTRSDAEFILQQGGIGVILHRLLSKPQDNKVTLREVLANTQDAYIAEEISKALARLEE